MWYIKRVRASKDHLRSDATEAQPKGLMMEIPIPEWENRKPDSPKRLAVAKLQAVQILRKYQRDDLDMYENMRYFMQIVRRLSKNDILSLLTKMQEEPEMQSCKNKWAELCFIYFFCWRSSLFELQVNVASFHVDIAGIFSTTSSPRPLQRKSSKQFWKSFNNAVNLMILQPCLCRAWVAWVLSTAEKWSSKWWWVAYIIVNVHSAAMKTER